MTKYELLYIIRPNIDDAAKTALVERFDKILTDNGATIESSKDWEKRRLAYEIKNFREGIYHIVNLEAESTAAALGEFDRLAKINGDILRHMFVIVEEFPNLPKAVRPVRNARAERSANVESEVSAKTSTETAISESSEEATEQEA